MELFLITFIVMGIAVLGMAIGVIAGREPIKGSCGGLDRLGLQCGICDKPCAKKRQAAKTAENR